jgi:hypothetical protein
MLDKGLLTLYSSFGLNSPFYIESLDQTMVCVCKRIFFGKDVVALQKCYLIELALFRSGWLTSHSIKIITYLDPLSHYLLFTRDYHSSYITFNDFPFFLT